MEGMYCHSASGNHTIILCSERPAGRQNYSCAHEIGHHEHGDGTRVDEFFDDAHGGNSRIPKKFDPVEFRAERFASFLLMPKLAVDSAFASRQLQPETCDPAGILVVAGYLGVGFRTLVEHLHFTLRSISESRANNLRRVSLPRLRTSMVGYPVKNIKVVDEHWKTPILDVLVGDTILAPLDWQVSGDNLTTQRPATPALPQSCQILQAIRQGESTLANFAAGMMIRVRTSSQGFVGRAIYRHLDDPDDLD
jgi:hypothetical protein